MLVLAENILLNDYWQQGIDHILCGEGDEAQDIWLIPFFDENLSIDEDQLSQSLIDYLSEAIEHETLAGNTTEAYELAQHLCIVATNNANALLILFNSSIRANEFDVKILADSSLLKVFSEALPIDINQDILDDFVASVTISITKQDSTIYIDFIKLIIHKIADTEKLICSLLAQSYQLGRNLKLYNIQIKILEICLKHASVDMRFDILFDLSSANIALQNFTAAILISEQCNDEGKLAGGEKQLLGSRQLLTALMEAGEWNRIPETAQQHQIIVQNFIENNQNADTNINSITTTLFLNYLYDEPIISHSIRNSIGGMCSKTINSTSKQVGLNGGHQPIPKNGRLRIGYIGSTLYKHSVGWLSRWLFKYHDRSNFEIFVYHVNQLTDDSFNHKFFRAEADKAYYLSVNAEEIADLISKDEIDILIDLDSLGLSTTYNVLCLKPAPISATWLGWDASGCPEVDYFIADPYVLPANAQEYYRSKIWRLPQTYVAIDGFEVESPTKRRSDYQLPADAIVYLCAQQSYKHHPDILRLQMQIIKQVPNSYLMVQLRANPESLIKTYQELADEVGISMEQLRFIQPDPDEMTHRANLQLADVVLDTFPYNGATTTLETLWMGVPMVTKVGQAFVARNSYAFMQNVGVTEGIAHTDTEYIDWGVKLGTDLALRQSVMGKLMHSRKTSPLWNARSFTINMEQAYRQMWNIYQSQQK
jgi:predicted O-linked N-acetylglucosamine transferase (SPINDLY family)